ncbi:MAG: hypothetical protein MUE85_11245 [Microscillaceae bacterium]|jgi:hypothetical protein|nr:hypothetical protein [Microscillaceae bacterium]
MPVFEESNIRFIFSEEYNLLKSDGEVNFEKVKQYLLNTKDIDFIGLFMNEKVFLMEVKNFCGVPGEEIEMLCNEVAQKLRDTIAIIVGASRNTTNNPDFWQKLHQSMGKANKEIIYVFWLEEDLIPRQRDRMSTIAAKLKQKCKWLTTRISVQSISNNSLPGLTVNYL